MSVPGDASASRRPTVSSLDLGDLLDLMEQGAVALPDFQRPYVWSEEKVQSLLATVVNGWPAGLILLMEAPPDSFFAIRPLEGGPPVSGQGVRHLVLDGQQRLTALLEGFSNAGRSWYLDLPLYVRGDHETEDCLRSFTREPALRWHQSGLPSVMPLSALRSNRSFLAWRDSIVANAPIDDEGWLYGELNRLWTGLASTPEYRFPVAILDRSMELSLVSRVFERLNTSGLPLDTFDLVVAHVYKDGFNLRERWDKELRDFPAVRAFAEDDPLLAVEIVSLLYLGDTRRESLLRLSSETVWVNWHKILRALDDAAIFLSDKCSISGKHQLPHRAIYLVLAALARDFPLEEYERQLRYWVYASALTERFDAAVNTRVVSEHRTLKERLASGGPVRVKISPSTLIDATRRGNGSVWRGVEAMIRHRAPRSLSLNLFDDLLPGETLDPVCVTAPLGRGRGDDPALGIALLTESAGRHVEHHGAESFARVLLAAPPAESAEFCRTQLLPPPGGRAYESDRTLLRRRAEIVVEELEAEYLMATSVSSPKSASLPNGARSGTPSLRVDDAERDVRVKRDALALARRQLGPTHASALHAMYDYGVALLGAGQLVEACDVLTECHRESVAVLGSEHPDTLATLGSLSVSLSRIGRSAEALELLQQYERAISRQFGVSSEEAARANASLAIALARSGRVDEAVHRFSRALEVSNPGAAHEVESRAKEFAADLARAVDRGDPVPSVLALFADILGDREMFGRDWGMPVD